MAALTDASRRAESHRSVVDGLARELALPVDQVERVYLAEVSRLRADARITTFVSVLAVGSARDKLRRRELPGH